MAFINRKAAGGGQFSGYIGPGTEIEGVVRFNDVLRVDGKITGRVVSEKELVVGETGHVEGEIEVGSLSVAGRVHGQVAIRSRMEIHPGGRVTGELFLETPHLVVEDGGAFEGNIRMTGAPAAGEGEPDASGRPSARVTEFPSRGASE